MNNSNIFILHSGRNWVVYQCGKMQHHRSFIPLVLVMVVWSHSQVITIRKRIYWRIHSSYRLSIPSHLSFLLSLCFLYSVTGKIYFFYQFQVDFIKTCLEYLEFLAFCINLENLHFFFEFWHDLLKFRCSLLPGNFLLISSTRGLRICYWESPWRDLQ